VEEHNVKKVSVELEIESAFRLKNPINEYEPSNSFVQIQWPFDKFTKESEMQTEAVF
jgi:hypothetical protein